MEDSEREAPSGSSMMQYSSSFVKIDTLDQSGDDKINTWLCGTDSYKDQQKRRHRIGVTMQGIPDLISASGRHRVLEDTAMLLERMPVWTIARNLRRRMLKLLACRETSTGYLSE
jgi:hypothetical protein